VIVKRIFFSLISPMALLSFRAWHAFHPAWFFQSSLGGNAQLSAHGVRNVTLPPPPPPPPPPTPPPPPPPTPQPQKHPTPPSLRAPLLSPHTKILTRPPQHKKYVFERGAPAQKGGLVLLGVWVKVGEVLGVGGGGGRVTFLTPCALN